MCYMASLCSFSSRLGASELSTIMYTFLSRASHASHASANASCWSVSDRTDRRQRCSVHWVTPPASLRSQPFSKRKARAFFSQVFCFVSSEGSSGAATTRSREKEAETKTTTIFSCVTHDESIFYLKLDIAIYTLLNIYTRIIFIHKLSRLNGLCQFCRWFG